MTLFSYRKRKEVDVVPPPGQNIYNAYDHHAPSPPPPPFIESNAHSYSNFLRRPLKEHEDVEKYNHQKFLLSEAEKMNRGSLSYSRLLCCCCFPCLPMWTRTLCCFMFLGLCGIIAIISFFIMMFEKPQIMFNGVSSQVADNTSNLRFQFSVYNGNFFEFDFENIKAVIYYPTPNRTTIGVGELSDLVLGPRSVTNITFPIQMMGDGYSGNRLDFNKDGDMQNNFSYNEEEAFANMVASCCDQNNGTEPNRQKKDTVVVFDLMPTIKIYGYRIVTLAFTGQTASMPCEKLKSFVNKNKEEIKN